MVHRKGLRVWPFNLAIAAVVIVYLGAVVVGLYGVFAGITFGKF